MVKNPSNNCRHILLISNVAKIYEKLLHIELKISHMNIIQSNKWYGFRKGKVLKMLRLLLNNVLKRVSCFDYK